VLEEEMTNEEKTKLAAESAGKGLAAPSKKSKTKNYLEKDHFQAVVCNCSLRLEKQRI